MGTVEVDGTRLFFEARGAGPPLLMIPGTGAHTGTMAAIADRLAGDYRTIAYDRRGHSQTVGPPAPRKGYLARHVADAAGLLRALDADNAIVFGWSWGAIVALALAIEHPELVQRLVLFEPPLHAKKHPTLTVLSGIGGAIILGKLGMHRRGALRFARAVLARPDGTNAFAELDEPMRESLLANAKTIIAELEAGTGEELTTDAIAAIRCPIGVIVGNRSQPFLQAAARRVQAASPATRVIDLTGDHLANLTQPDELARAIRACLA